MTRKRKNIMRDNPPTGIANDGTTKLRRYRVDAVIYARNVTEARARLREVEHVFDDAMIEPPRARRARP